MAGTELTETTTPAHRAIAKLGGPGIPEIIPQNMDEVWRFSQVVARSGLTPKGIDKPEQITIQMLMGFDLGLKPMVAIQNIHVINNKPCIGGDLALSILLNSGLLEEHDERIEGEGDNRVAYCTVTRKGYKSIERKFSVKDAIQAGLWQTEPMVFKEYFDRKINKRVKSQFATPNDSPWWRFQDRMLIMRARGFAFRDRFTDVLKGMHLTEEMDAQHEEVRVGSGPSAPPTEEMQDITELPQVEHRQDTRSTQPSGPSAPPEIEDADIVEGERRAEEKAGEMRGAGDPQDSHGDAGMPGGEQDSHVEPFDFAPWIQEVRDLVATCTDADALNSVEDMFSNTADEALGRYQRDEYDDVIGSAYARIEKALAAGAVEKPAEETKPGPAMVDDDAEDKPAEPTQGEIYEAEITAAINDPAVTSPALAELWLGAKLRRKELVSKGHWTVDARKILQDAVNAAIDAKWKAEQPAANSPEIPEGSTESTTSESPSKPAEQSSQDPKAAFTEKLKAKLDACTTADEVSAYSTETLPERNELVAPNGDETFTKLWRTMIKQRRDALA